MSSILETLGIIFIIFIIVYVVNKLLNKQNPENTIIYINRASYVFVIISFMSPLLILYYNKKSGLKDIGSQLGPIGDWLGGSTAPLIGLASYMMILATYSTQKQELKHTKEIMNQQIEQIDQQNTMISKQQFESTFFQLLSLHNEISNSLQYPITEGSVQGRNAFKNMYQEMQDFFLKPPSGDQIEFRYDLIKQYYDAWYHQNEQYVGHYLRNLYHIFKVIDRQQFTQVEKQEYSNIVRAQLSRYELLILFYNSVSRLEKINYSKIIKSYNLFKHLNTNELLLPQDKLILEKEFLYVSQSDKK